MHRKAITLTAVACSSLPFQEIAFLLPHRLEFPFVVAVACALVMTLVFATSAAAGPVAAPEIESKALVTMLREVAVANCHLHGSVTADDLRRVATAAEVTLSPGVFGHVFGSKFFKRSGDVVSRDPNNHGRKIGRYVLASQS